MENKENYKCIDKVHAFNPGTINTEHSLNMKNYNPICPFTKMDCIKFMEDVNCKSCTEYGNGVRATGSLPDLKSEMKFMKRILLIICIVLIILLYLPMIFIYGGLFLVGRGLWHPSDWHLVYISKLIKKIM